MVLFKDTPTKRSTCLFSIGERGVLLIQVGARPTYFCDEPAKLRKNANESPLGAKSESASGGKNYLKISAWKINTAKLALHAARLMGCALHDFRPCNHFALSLSAPQRERKDAADGPRAPKFM
jgi:hypothetical protein